MKPKKLAALVLATVLTLGAVTACGKEATTVMTFRDTTMTDSEYEYLLGKYKAAMLTLSGMTADNEQIWTSVIANGVTYGQFYQALADSSIMTNLILEQLFKENGLTITAEERSTVVSAIDSLADGAGGKSKFNRALEPYGVDYDTLIDINLDQLKCAKVQDHLYGENGIYTATDEELDEYYNENYRLVKYIVIRRDKEFVYDEAGQPILDEEAGTYKTRELTEEEVVEKKHLAQELRERILNGGEDFDTLLTEYTMDMGMLHFADGYYITSTSTYLDSTVRDEVFDMDIGEIRSLDTDAGWYIIKRCELREGAYEDEAYAASMFGDLTSAVNDTKLQEYVAAFASEIATNDTVLDSISFAKVKPNFEY